MTSSSSTRSHGAGFTLIELALCLLVGLALVAAVAPALRLAVIESPRTACLDHLRELGQGHLAWAADHNDWLVLVPRNSDGSPEYVGGFLSNQSFFYRHALDLGTGGYVLNPQFWACPGDQVDGPGDDIRVRAATIYNPSFNGIQNISYLYIAGHNISSTPEDPLTTPVMADESNESESGAVTPTALPDLDAQDNHGAAYRNVLYLDGHVGGLSGTNAVNDFTASILVPFPLQAVD